MPVKVRIPTALQKLTKNEGEVQAQGSNVNEVFDDMEGRFPGLKERLYDDSGEIRRFINIYVNDEDIRFLNGGKTSVKDGDELSIIPAIAGGQRDRPRAGAASVASGPRKIQPGAKSEVSAEQPGEGLEP